MSFLIGNAKSNELSSSITLIDDLFDVSIVIVDEALEHLNILLDPHAAICRLFQPAIRLSNEVHRSATLDEELGDLANPCYLL